MTNARMTLMLPAGQHIAGISKTTYVLATPRCLEWKRDLQGTTLRHPLPRQPAPARRPPRRLGMIPLSLGEIAAVVGGTAEGDGAVTVTAPAVLDGRQAEPGGLFVAFAGEHVDGHGYAGQAGQAGAVAVLGSRPTPLPTVVVEDAQAALQALAAHVAARLRDGLTVAGLTGSQGKTSTKDLLAVVLSSAAPTIATIGSLNNEPGRPLTMPPPHAAPPFLVPEM